METQPQKPNFEPNVDTEFLMKRLKKLAVGEQISYMELAKEIGKSEPLNGSHSQLQSALRKCQRDGLFFENVRGVGYVRMSDAEICAASENDVSRVRRAAKRHLKRLGSVNYSNLDDSQKVAFNTNATILGTVTQFTGKKAIKEISNKVREKNSRIPVAETLALFK